MLHLTGALNVRDFIQALERRTDSSRIEATPVCTLFFPQLISRADSIHKIGSIQSLWEDIPSMDFPQTPQTIRPSP